MIDSAKAQGITNIIFDQTIIRGFDYYTGFIFEVFDNHPENNRSLFGGGRYDDLLNLFTDEKVPACGFGMGDVTIADFLATRKALPSYVPATQLMICIVEPSVYEKASELAHEIRTEGISVALNHTFRGIGDQIKNAEKLKIPYILIYGPDEATMSSYKIKELATGTEFSDIKTLPIFPKDIMRKIVFDIETKNTFQEVGKADPTLLDISVVCIYDSETDSYSSYLQEDFIKLWPILERADVLITFNGDHFDIPLLNKYYSGDLTKIKSLDILKEIRKSLGFRVGLDNIASATLGKGKIGHGLEAIEWWKNGEIEKIIKYCIGDVEITKEVYEYAMKHGALKYKEGEAIMEFKLDTADWDKKQDTMMTFSLPF